MQKSRHKGTLGSPTIPTPGGRGGWWRLSFRAFDQRPLNQIRESRVWGSGRALARLQGTESSGIE